MQLGSHWEAEARGWDGGAGELKLEIMINRMRLYPIVFQQLASGLNHIPHHTLVGYDVVRGVWKASRGLDKVSRE